MASSYLALAEIILREAKKPLTPAAIMEAGYELGLVPWHLFGKTQQKTLHARLSEDIANSREKSRFYRTAPGIFFLSELRSDPAIAEIHPRVHLAPPRRKDLHKGLALCLSRRKLKDIVQPSGRVEVADLENVLSAGDYTYEQKINVVKSDAEFIPVSSFVLVHVGVDILSFRTGKYIRIENEPIHRGIGFGDIVSDKDRDLLYNSFWGVKENAIQDLIYGIGLEQSAARSARYDDLLQLKMAYCSSSELARLNVIMSYHYRSNEPIQGRSLAFSDLRWISPMDDVIEIDKYDETSRVMIENEWIIDCVS